VVFKRVALDHLGLQPEPAVDVMQLIPDRRGVVAGDAGGGHHGVDYGPIGSAAYNTHARKS
jgi:hypothetical protein